MDTITIKLQILITILCISSPWLKAQTNSSQSWQADLDYIVENLKSQHPNPFHKLTVEEFQNNKLRAQDIIEVAQTDIESYLAIREFIASVQDGHTGLSYSGNFDVHKPIFPFRIAKFSDGYFIAGISHDFKEYFGHEVKSINSKPLNEIYSTLSRVAIADNDFGRLARIPRILSYASILKGLNLIDSLSYMDLELIDRNGHIVNARIKSVESINYDSYVNLKKSLNNKLPLYLQNEDKYYWFTHVMNERSIYFQFNAVGNQGKESFQQFSDRLWKYMDDNKTEIDKLIIDIRNNGGGYGRLLMPFINEIIKRDYINKSGKLFVLTSKWTYSAAVVFITDLLQHCNVIYVGEPPASPSNFFSNSISVGQLPNSGFSLRVASRQIDNAWSNEREYFSPDIPAPFSSIDFFNGLDPGLEQVFHGDNRMIEDIALEDGIDKALLIYNQLKGKNVLESWWTESPKLEARVNLAGYGYLNSHELGKAYTLFELNTELFSDSYNVWDSFGEIHMIQDDFKSALSSYNKALLCLDENDNRKRIVERNVNAIGYDFLGQLEIEKAINIFILNTELFPDSANTYDSLAEAYLKNGNQSLALVNYTKSMELNPRNQTAIDFINKNSEK